MTKSRSLAPILPFLLVCGALTGCAARLSSEAWKRTAVAVETKPRPAAGEFNRIEVRGSIDVVVHEGRSHAVAVTMDDEDQARVKTAVEGDTLVIDFDAPERFCIGFCRGPEDDATVTVDLPALRSVKILGSGDVVVEGAGEHPEVDFLLEGSGDLRYSGNADVVRCRIDGSGDVVLRGAGKRLEARIDGSGDLKAHDFAVEGGAYDIEGSGDVTTDLHGGDTTIHIHGSGDLLYSGEAKITRLEVSGSGEVRQR